MCVGTFAVDFIYIFKINRSNKLTLVSIYFLCLFKQIWKPMVAYFNYGL